MNNVYNESFAKSELRNKEWVADFCRVLLDKFSPNSVIDFGCGTGDILAPFERKGITILGLDGSDFNRRYAHIKKDNFIVYDLRKRYFPKKKYDLCLCLEVAEHIDEEYSNMLIDSLISSSSTIIFTAAPPGQGGHDHCNLKPKGWWIKKFKNKKFNFINDLTNDLKKEMEKIKHIQVWYINNLMVFKKEE